VRGCILKPTTNGLVFVGKWFSRVVCKCFWCNCAFKHKTTTMQYVMDEPGSRFEALDSTGQVIMSRYHRGLSDWYQKQKKKV
jgi:hypothetical protein